MTIKVGDKMPSGTLTLITRDGPQKISTDEYFQGKKVVLFSVPGAFTPTCDAKHLPGFVEKAGELKGKGVDTIACMAVNDVFVLNRWARDHNARGKVLMLADGNGDFAIKSGLAVDLSEFGLGIRSNRYAMFVADRQVSLLSVEDVLSNHDKSSAASLCGMMERGV